MIQEKGIVLKCETEERLRFCGNRQLLSRLLTNLISNAFRYGRENGHIFVKLASKEDQIFQRFYQADNSHSGSGTGLGLSMVKEIARFHGGEICVESEIGVGSTFCIIFKI